MPRLLALLNLLALAGTIYANFAVTQLATALGLPARAVGALSDAYPNYFVPAGVTFAIWGLIYLALTGFGVYQGRALLGQAVPELSAIGGLFILSCLLNVGWLLVWLSERPAWALVVMLGLLGTLLAIYLRLGIGTAPVSPAVRWLVHAPFSLYLGWISVATIANVTTWLVNQGWTGGPLTEASWAAVMVVVAALLALGMVWLRQDYVFAGVVLWALLGIWLRRQATGTPEDLLVMRSVYVAAGLLLAGSAWRIWRG